MRKRSFVERNNDDILLVQYLGPIVHFIIAIIIIALIVAGVKIKNHIVAKKEAAEVQKIYETRLDIVNNYIEHNSKIFGDIESIWNEDNLFYIKNDDGIYSIRFVETKIFEVLLYPESGDKPITIYK